MANSKLTASKVIPSRVLMGKIKAATEWAVRSCLQIVQGRLLVCFTDNVKGLKLPYRKELWKMNDMQLRKKLFLASAETPAFIFKGTESFCQNEVPNVLLSCENPLIVPMLLLNTYKCDFLSLEEK